MRKYGNDLEKIEKDGLTRVLPVRRLEMLEFSSNDYLGLADHPLLKEASIRAIELYGSSVAASRLMSGNIALHEELEIRLALQPESRSCSIIFPSYYELFLHQVESRTAFRQDGGNTQERIGKDTSGQVIEHRASIRPS